MATFEQTSIALQDFEANRAYLPGFHEGSVTKPALIGRHVGDVAFDAAVHDPAMINPLSVWTQVLGMPHVSLMLVDRPLHMNVVVHKAKSNEDSEFSRAKEIISEGLVGSMDGALPGMTDRLHTYYIGDVDKRLERDAVHVIPTADPTVAAQKVAEVCDTGLTMVISDFNALPLDEIAGAEYTMAVGIKVNHPGDVVLPARIGRMSVGGLGEVNTDKPKELVKANTALHSHHERIVGRLQRTGLAVAHIVFNHRNTSGLGFDIDAADRDIASAIRQIIPR